MKRLIRCFLGPFSSSTRRWLSVSLLLLSMIPLLALTFTNRYSIQHQLTRQSGEIYSMALQQAASFVSDKASLVRSLVNMICGDSTVQTITDYNTLQIKEYDGEWMLDASNNQIIYKGYLLGAVSRITLYKDGVGNPFESSALYDRMNDTQREHYHAWRADASRPHLFITLPESQHGKASQYIYLITKIPSTQRLGVSFGLMQANISSFVFQKILQDTPASANTALYLLNSSGQVFAHSGSIPADDSVFVTIRQNLKSQESSEIDSFTSIKLDGKHYLAGIADISNTGWQVAMLVPYDDMTGITQRANHYLLLTIAALLLLIIPLTGLISRRFTQPILSLQRGVNAISAGDYSVTIPRCDNNDFNQVIDSFNFMTMRTKEMMADQYEMGQALKNAELQMLQEQINPHFLYNTLDLLHWQARKAGAEDIVDVVHSLSQFYKRSLGHGMETVSLEHELQHIEAYVHIQNIRFLNRIRLIIDVPEDVRSCSIVKIVLQPLVENAIQHGIREKDDESGTILITGRAHESEVILSIADDGVGMDEQTLAGILEHSGHGASNVSERLVLHYGQGAKLQYESCPGGGTVVTTRIPYVPMDTTSIRAQ